MANRTVEVRLKLLTSEYGPEADRMAAKTDKLDRSVEGVDRDLRKLPPDAAKAAAAMKLLGDDAGRASMKLDEIGKSSTSMEQLDKRLISARSEVRKLAEEFNRTGNSSTLTKLFSAGDDVKELENLRKKLTNALELGGKEGAKSVSASMQGALSTPVLGPAIAAAIAAAIVVAAPVILGALNGVLLSGIGLSGIALGIVGQIHDPAVHRAWADMGHDLMRTLTLATASFKQPLIGVAGILGDALKQAIGSIDFKSLSGLVGPLAGGLGGLVTGMMPGFNRALEAARPILEEFAHALPQIGQAISDMFADFARSGHGAEEGMRILVFALVGLIATIGKVVLIGSRLLEFFVRQGEVISDVTRKLGGWMFGVGQLADAAHKVFHAISSGTGDIYITGRALTALGADASLTADDMDQLAGKIGKVTQTSSTLAAAMSAKVFGAIMTADEATLHWHESLLSLHDALAQNGRAIDKHTGLVSMNTKEGLANREAVLAAMTANMAQYQAFVAVGGSAADATKMYDANTAALEKQLRAAGYNTAQINDMIGSLKGVPAKVDADIAINGLTAAINNLGNLIADLNGLNGRSYGFTVTEKHVYESDYISHSSGERSPTGRRWGGITTHAAAGLLRDAQVYSPVNPARYAFAEPATGGEAFVPRFGDTNRSTGIIKTAAGWYGMDVVPRARGGVGGGPSTINLNATFIDGATGEVIHRRLITYSLDTGRTPAQLFPASQR